MRELMLWFIIILVVIGGITLVTNYQKEFYYNVWYEDMVSETVEQYLEEKEQTENKKMVLDEQSMVELLFTIRERIEATEAEGFEDLVERINEIEEEYQSFYEED